MELKEMHVWFRQYAQQMGMQHTRAILPEQIDLCINTSISDITNQIVKEHVLVTNDRVLTDNSKLGQINALSTLYTVEEIQLCTPSTSQDIIFAFKSNDKYDGKISAKFIASQTSQAFPIKFLHLLNFDIKYAQVVDNLGYVGNFSGENDIDDDLPKIDETKTTRYFPVRIIDDMFLADTLNDYILKNRFRSPIATINRLGIDIYIEEFNEVEAKETTDFDYTDGVRYVLKNKFIPYKLRVSYIKAPNKVKLNSDLDPLAKDEECDIPEYLQIDVLKHAVDLYRIAVSGALQASQQQAQNQQQENIRNNGLQR